MKLVLLLIFVGLQTLSAQSSISLAAVTEVYCKGQKGKTTLQFSNRGKDPLRFSESQSSHPNIKIKVPDKPIKAGSIGYFFISYDFGAIPKEQALTFIIETNDYKKPKISLQLIRRD